jgi:hypothetical protein
MKKYTVKVTSPEYWQEIHDLLCEETSCDHIPDRKVSCWDEKLHSPTRGTFELEDAEAEELKNHEHIEWVELSPTDNPDSFPKPQPATKRFKGNVKVYRDLGVNAPPSTNPTSAENRRTSWAVKRVGLQTNGDGWLNATGNPAVINSDVSYSLTGKNVDIVIHDSGVLQYHPEFLDSNGQSRVRDIVLDGPFYIDPNYFITNNYTYIKPDGRTGITTASAEGWWENSASRSAAFQSEGTVSIPASYTAPNVLGVRLDGTNTLGDGHGTACAGLSAGKYMGLAFESNIWNMPGIGDNGGLTIEQNYDLMKIWHRNKPTNPQTGRPNPTVINGSWGYQAAFYSSDNVQYKFRGTTGSFTGNAATTDQVTAMKNGLNNQVSGAYASWSSSSRSSSTNTAADEMMAEGVIYVAAAGNNNQRLGIGVNDPDRLNWMDDDYFGAGDPRSEFSASVRACPCNHRDWLNPQGIGFDSANDFHPVVCVGAMDEFIETNYAERKASYSNNGPGIDVWAPADETLAPGTNGIAGYIDYQRYDDTRFYDCLFNGTSAAAPVATGVIALYLEANPLATSEQVKNWLKTDGSKLAGNFYVDQYTDDTTTTYWTGFYNMRGAEKRILYDNSASDTKPSMSGVSVSGISFTQS